VVFITNEVAGAIKKRAGSEYQLPGPSEALGGFGQVVDWIVVLYESGRQLIGLAAVKAACGLAFEDEDPPWHEKSPAGQSAGHGVFGPLCATLFITVHHPAFDS
jgi:hypothetical protein